MFEQATCWIDGDIKPVSEAKISIFDHGFLYGDGIFEGVRFYNNKTFRLPFHIQRLQDSAAALMLEVPLSDTALTEAIEQVIQVSPLDQGYLRIIVTRGVGILGINPASCVQPSVIIIADELQMVSDDKRDQGIKAITASTRRNMPDRLDPRIKSLNYLNSIMARIEANYAGADEAIFLNDRGCVSEGTTENIFITKQNVLLTPPPQEGALAGITRQSIIELALENGVSVKEQPITPYDLYTADECFLTGTGARLIPVREIDGRVLKHCPGEYYQKLSGYYLDLIERETMGILV